MHRICLWVGGLGFIARRSRGFTRIHGNRREKEDAKNEIFGTTQT